MRIQPLCIVASVCACLQGACAAAATRPTTKPAAYSKLTAAQLVEVASVLAQNGDNLRAEQYLQEAIKQGAEPARMVPQLLHLYVDEGQYRQAIDLSEDHLRKHPSDHRVRLILGNLYGALGFDQNAVEQYARVIGDAPGDAQAHFALASVLHDSGRERARADEHYRAYLRIEPHGQHAEEARSLLLTELP